MPALRRLAHRVIEAGVTGFNRNPWTNEALELTARRGDGALYDRDGLRTEHNHSFIETPEFQRAYRRAVRASGWDYRIQWRVHVILWAATSAQRLEGAFVECGTGRGFMASAICEHLGWDDRPFFLFDTFEPGGLGPGSSRRSETPSPVYATGPDEVGQNFLEWPGVRLVIGTVPESLAQVEIDSVAFLHIDMNHPDPETAALRHFWPKLSPGAVIVLDDYAFAGYEASHRAADGVAGDLGFSILSLPTGQGLAIKPSA